MDGRIGDLGNYPLSAAPEGGWGWRGRHFSNLRFTSLEGKTGRQNDHQREGCFSPFRNLLASILSFPSLAVTVTVTMALSWQDHLVTSCSRSLFLCFPHFPSLNGTKLNTHTNMLFKHTVLVFCLSTKRTHTPHTDTHRLNGGMLRGNEG